VKSILARHRFKFAHMSAKNFGRAKGQLRAIFLAIAVSIQFHLLQNRLVVLLTVLGEKSAGTRQNISPISQNALFSQCRCQVWRRKKFLKLLRPKLIRRVGADTRFWRFF